MKIINVAKSYLPPVEEYKQLVDKIWENGQLTNQGPLLRKFEKEAKNYLNLDSFHFVQNGTVALQLAIRSLGITEGEIITTPFSYVATTSAILWERCTPVFVDIEPENYCIDADKIEASITPNTKAILAVHVFGYACDVEKIQLLAEKYGLKVIYDAAHAFGVKYKDRSLLSYGDISTCSFHATKLFHTIEGGCLVVNSKDVDSKVELMKRFGHNGDDHIMLGINAKVSELHAAMGICNLPVVDKLIVERMRISQLYDKLLNGRFKLPSKQQDIDYNYAYYPVLLDNEQQLIECLNRLGLLNIYPRRYFYPSLNQLPYLKDYRQICSISENIASRILCLPLYSDLEDEDIKIIVRELLK